MYKEEYKRWLEADLLDVDLKTELMNIADDDDAIKERFAVALQFGTAGLRGTLGAGTNRMNIWVVRQATQGVADWVLTQGGTQTVAIKTQGLEFCKGCGRRIGCQRHQCQNLR